jgi:hypothetical protein
MSPKAEFQKRIGRVEKLIAMLDSCSGPDLRMSARELMEAVMELHGAGLERIVEIVSQSEESGALLLDTLADDELVGSLLVLYGMHPADFETRARKGLDQAGAILRRHGAHLDQIDVGEASVHARIVGGESGEPEKVVREALLAAVPDAEEIGISLAPPGAQAETAPRSGFVPLSKVKSANGEPALAVAGKP